MTEIITMIRLSFLRLNDFSSNHFTSVRSCFGVYRKGTKAEMNKQYRHLTNFSIIARYWIRCIDC